MRSLRPAHLIALLILLLVLLGAATAADAYLSRRELIGGLDALGAAQAQMPSTTAVPDVRRRLDAITGDLALAHAHFSRARIWLGIVAPLFDRLGWLPIIGPQLAAANGVAVMADSATVAGQDLAAGLAPVITLLSAGPQHGRSVKDGLAILRAHHAVFAAACRETAAATEARRALGSPHIAYLSAHLPTFDRELPRLRTLCGTLQTLPALLGSPTSRRYFIAYQNPNELRATGGFIGSFEIVTVQDGAVSARFGGAAIGKRERWVVPAPVPVSTYQPEFFWILRDANWSPDFPTTAQIEEYILRLDGQGKVDGVINLTPQAAAAFLAVTGPVYSPEYNTRVSAANVAQLADYYSHDTPNTGPYVFSNKDTQRKQFVGIIARLVINRLQTLPLTKILAIGQVAAGAAGKGDILVYTNVRDQERVIRSLGFAGSISPVTSDYLNIVDSNMSYNKINPEVTMTTTDDVRIRTDRWLDVRLTIRIHNAAHAHPGQEGYGPGGGTLGGPLDYADFLRIYAATGAQLIEQSGWTQPWESGPAYGKTMFCGYNIVLDGQTNTIRLHYVVPPNVFTWSHGRTYRLYLQHQSGSHPTVTVRADAGTGHIRTWKLGALQRDVDLRTSIPARAFQPIPLAAQPPLIVAPGHLIEPHALLSGPPA